MLSGITKLDKVIDTATFSNLQILSSGLFNLNANGQGLQSASFSNIQIKNYVKTINVTSSVQATTKGGKFNIYINLYGDDDLKFIKTTVVTLSYINGNIAQTLNITANNGSVTFYSLSVNNQDYVDFSATTTSDGASVIINKALVLFFTGEISVSLNSTVSFYKAFNK